MELRKPSKEAIQRAKDVRCARARANRPLGRVFRSNSKEEKRVAAIKWRNRGNQRDDVNGTEERGERGGIETPRFLTENSKIKRVENGGREKSSLHVMRRVVKTSLGDDLLYHNVNSLMREARLGRLRMRTSSFWEGILSLMTIFGVSSCFASFSS